MKSRLAITCAVFVLASIAVWIYLRSPASPQDDKNKKAVDQATHGAPSATRNSPPQLDLAPPPDDWTEVPEEVFATPVEIDPPSAENARADSLERMKKSLQIYRDFTKYPPWSRPYGDNTVHYAEWNTLRPEGQAFAVDDQNRELWVKVHLDRMYAGPGETINAVVELGRLEDGQLVAASFDEVSARIEWNDPVAGYQLAHKLTLNQVGSNYMVSFAPDQIAALAVEQREALFTAEVKEGLFFKVIRMPFQYAIEPAFEVLAIADDRIADGSLQVDLEVVVGRAVPTLIQAVLYDQRGQTPIAVFDDYVRPTDVGKQIATLTFFGKVLREKNVNGRYSIRALHGVVRAPDDEGGELYWKRDDTPVLLTRSYYATQFSDAEWSDPEKDKKIAQYETMIESGPL